MRKLLIFSLILLFSSSQLWAGWKIVINETEQGVQQVVYYYISKDYIKITTKDKDFIYSKKDQNVTVINQRIKCFFTGKVSDYQSQIKDISKIDSWKVETSIPLSYLQRFDYLLKQNIRENQENNVRTTPSLSIERKDNTSIADYNAQEYLVKFDTLNIERIWLSQDVQITEIDVLEAYEVLRGQKNTGLSMSSSINTQEYEDLAFQGFPLRIINYDNYGSEVYFYEVVLIQEMEMNIEETYNAPSDYQKLSLADIILASDD